MYNFWETFMVQLPDLIIAVIYLIIAFVVALLASKITVRILNMIGTEEFLAKSGVRDEKTGKTVEFVGKLAFLIVFLLFLPAVLARLGMDNVASPITSMVAVVIGYLPNLLAAGLILYIGIYVAKVVRQIIKALLNRVGLNKLQEKLGVETTEEQNTFAGVLAGIAYVLILIVVIIASLQALGIESVSEPATLILSQIFSYIPSIFVAIVLLVVGYQLAKMIAPVVESLLISVGTDKLIQKLTSTGETSTVKISVSKVISEMVRWLILIVFFIEAVNLLNLEILATIGTAILGYLPFVISAIIIMGGGLILASWIEGLILKHSPRQKTLALIVKVSIIVLAVFMTLSQLGFAHSIVNLAFIIILAGLAVAFAIAFGFGGRTFAENRLAKLEKKLDDPSDDQ